MKRVVLALKLAAVACATPVFALDLDPTSRTNAVQAAAGKVALSPAPARAPLPDLDYGLDNAGRTLSGGCAKESTDLCYDYKEGRIIYRPTRNFMPEISGLTREHISVRRDKLIFKYSFK